MRGAGQQTRDEVVPHHPAGGGEPEEAVGGPKVGVQSEHLESARGGCRRARERSASACRSCPMSRGRTADDRPRTCSNSMGSASDDRSSHGTVVRYGFVAEVLHDATVVLEASRAHRESPSPRRDDRCRGRRIDSHRRPAAPSGSICPKRSSTACTPNSGAQRVQVAPRLAVARNAMIVSGTFGR